MKINPQKMVRLAKAFSYVMKAWHTDKQMRRIVELNKEEKDDLICHSHDFYDANQAMIDAFNMIYSKDPDVQNEDHMTMMNGAWAVAKLNEFFVND